MFKINNNLKIFLLILTALLVLFFVSEFFGFISKDYDKRINIQRFGTFLERKTPKRVGRNPKTKEEFIIKERQKISFVPSSDLKRSINKGSPDPL